MNYTKDHLKAALSAIEALPPVENKLDAKQLVAKLKPQIKSALARGQSFKTISAGLQKSGIKISGGTLQRYFKNSAFAPKKVPSKVPENSAQTSTE